MKKVFFVLFALLLLINCAAVDGLDFVDITETPANTAVSGYPRFAVLDDGTLIMTSDSNSVSFSTDKGKTWKKGGRAPTAAAAAEKTTESGITHKLTRANLQPFTLADGRVLLAYRSHTSNYSGSGEFYTSIRVMVSESGGKFYKDEKILVENVAYGSGRGFWEPFFIQLDSDTVAMYYADDLSTLLKSQQRIAYFTYKISTDEWAGPFDAVHRKIGVLSRDGMPTVTALRSGGFAMVVEVQDYASWNSNKDSVFAVGLSLSKDGKVWSDPVPVIGPEDLSAGIRTSAPSIATLPDGRVIITYQTDKGYYGANGSGDYKRVFGAAISKGALTLDSALVPTVGGASEGFEFLPDLFEYSENQYQIWNTVSCFGNDVYFAGTSGINTADGKRTSHRINLRRAEVTTLMGDIDGDGKITEVDAKTAVKLVGESAWNENAYIADVNASGKIELKDVFEIIKMQKRG